ncbi:dihydrofolate reductase, partial [Mycobacterium tuberculosis]|nr:dihydrofolate reductase [Mycobacterium tuberculosis]
AAKTGATEVIVAGGAEIYRAALPLADRIELTEVALTPDGDARFPALDPAAWEEVARVGPERGPKDDADMVFVTLRKRGS